MSGSQREFEAILPVGYTDAKGQVHRRVVLRKMCGRDEELLYDDSLNTGNMVTELLKNCMMSLGEIVEINTEIVSHLYTADRNFLLLELRRISLGNELQSSYNCPHCGSRVSVVENLDEIDIRRLETDQALQDVQVSLQDGYLDREGKTHVDLTLTLPRGIDEESVAPMVARDPLKAQDALLLRCIKAFGTLPKAALDAYGIKILRDLTLGDRRILQAALSDDLPGINFQRLVHCGPCNNDFHGVMDVSNFFA